MSMMSTSAVDAPAEMRFHFPQDAQATFGKRKAEAPRALDFVARNVTTAVGAVAAVAVTIFSSPTMATHAPSAAAEAFCPHLWSITLPSTMQAAAVEMESYRGMKDGWDGRGSVAPDDRVISTAQWFLGLLPRDSVPPEATASADGDAGWYWKTPKSKVSVIFQKGGRMLYYGQRNGEPTARGAYTLLGTTAIPSDLLDTIRAL